MRLIQADVVFEVKWLGEHLGITRLHQPLNEKGEFLWYSYLWSPSLTSMLFFSFIVVLFYHHTSADLFYRCSRSGSSDLLVAQECFSRILVSQRSERARQKGGMFDKSEWDPRAQAGRSEHSTTHNQIILSIRIVLVFTQKKDSKSKLIP